MVGISSRDELEEWLADKPREVAVAIAARTALRVVPVWPRVLKEIGDRERAAILLPVFRANAAASVAAGGPTDAAEVKKAANAAAGAAAGATYPDAAAAANAAATVYAASAANNAAITAANATNPAYAAAAAAAAAWEAVSEDCALLEQWQGETGGWDPARLMARRLWPGAGWGEAWGENWDGTGAMPDHLREGWETLKATLEAVEGEDWQVWTDWYQARLDGDPLDPALEEKRVLIPAHLWDDGPAAANAALREVIEDHRRGQPAPEPQAVAEKTPISRVVEVERSTGNLVSRPPPQRTEAPGEITNTAVVDNVRRKLKRHLDRFAERPLQYRIETVLDTVADAIAADNDQPEIVHDDCEEALLDLRALIQAGDLPELDTAPELAALDRDLNRAVSDLRGVYPQLERMAQARRTVRMRPLTPDEQAAMGRMVDAFEEIVDQGLKDELKADLEGIREEAGPTPDPDLAMPEGPVKNRLYDLVGKLSRIARYAQMAPEKLSALFDRGFDFARKLPAYQNAWETIKPYWEAIGDFLRSIVSGG